MEADLLDVKAIIKSACLDTRCNKLRWKIFLPDNEHITFVAKRNIRKKKKQVTVYEILKCRTEHGTYVIFYNDSQGFYIPYSSFKHLELDIMDTNPTIIKKHYVINKRTANTLADIANNPTAKKHIQKKHKENHVDVPKNETIEPLSIIKLGGEEFSKQLIDATEKKEIKWYVYKDGQDIIYYLDEKSIFGYKFAISKMVKKDVTDWKVNIDGRDSCEKLNWGLVEKAILMFSPVESKDTPIAMSKISLVVLKEWNKKHPHSKEINGQAHARNENKDGITMIGMKDFLVRRNVFKCMHKNHHLENIDAEITVTSRIGKDRVIPFTAGYCKECRLFFVLESTYEHLKKYGVLNCRVSDEKSYMKSVSSNGMMLAQESILMQYGYTVSREYDLTEITRHKILANLIDNHIMTKNEIISYLDFFISQHTSSIYQMAVGKWEIDREFVRDYNIGRYTKYGVGGIKR